MRIREPAATHNLLLVVERATLTRYEHLQTDGDEKADVNRLYLDQFFIDGDGTAELSFRRWFDESWDHGGLAGEAGREVGRDLRARRRSVAVRQLL